MYIEARQKIGKESFNEETVKELQDTVKKIVDADVNITGLDYAEIAKKIEEISKMDASPEKTKAYEDVMKEISEKSLALEKAGYPDKTLTKEELSKKIKEAKENNYLNNQALGIDSIAFGYGASTSGDNDGEAGKHGVAIGFKSRANAQSSIALGDGASVGVGSLNGIAIGKEAKIIDNMNDSISIGNGAVASEKNSIALGKGAKTERVSKITSNKIGNILYGKFAGDPTTNGESRVLSVGKSGEERTIANVAAGRVEDNSTDAINGSQLYATNKVLSNLANTSKNVLGDSFELDENGEISVKTGGIGGTGKNTVSEAISSLGNKTLTLSDGTSQIIRNLSSDPKFVLAGNDDVKVKVTNDQMNFSIKKGEVKSGETKVVSGDTVYNAIAAAKPLVKGNGIVNVEGQKTKDLSGNTFTVSINEAELKKTLNDDYVTKTDYKDGNNIDANKWKETLGVSDLALHYKADGENSDRTTTLAKGLTFKGDDNIRAITEDDGVIKHTLNKDLTGINSIGGNDKKISLTSAGIDLNNGKIINMGSGTIGAESKEAVTGGDVYKTLQEYAKNSDVSKKYLNVANANITFTDGANSSYKINLADNSASRTLKFVTSGVEILSNDKSKNLSATIDGNSGELILKHSLTPTFDKLTVGDFTITPPKGDGEPGLVVAGGYKISVIADGEVNDGSQAAVNGRQLYKVREEAREGIKTNKASITENKTAIAENKTAIQSNKNDIAINKGNIQTNTDAIGRHETAIESNKNDIATNKRDIQSNTGAIDENRKNIAKGWNIKVVDGSTDTEGNIQLGEKLTVEGTGNIKTEFNQAGKKLTVKMVDNPSFTSANIGGIDLADGKISNVSSSAATGSVATYEQLKPVFKALNLSPDGTSGIVNDGDLTGKYLGKDNVEEALKVPITFEDTHNNKAQVSLGEKVAFGANGPVDIKLDSTKKKYTISISENPTFTGKVTATGGFDANNEKIINLADGSSPTDAVTLKQLKAVESQINNTTATAIALSTNAPVVYTAPNDNQNQEIVVKIETEHGTKYYYKRDLDYQNGTFKPNTGAHPINDPKQIQVSTINPEGSVTEKIKFGNLANGNIKSGSTDAITGDQLAPVIKALGMKANDENKVKLPKYETGNDKTYDNVRDVFLGRAKGEYGTSVFKNGTDKVVYTTKAQNSEPGYYKVSDLESEGLEAKADATPVNEDEVKISLQKHDGGNVVLGNLADGKDPNDAVNVSQLSKFGLDVNSTKPVVTYTDGNKKKIELEGGADGTKITNVAKGIDEKDAVNVGQVNEIKNSLSNDIQTIKNDTWKLAAGGTLEPINVKQGETVAFVGDNSIDVSKTDETAKHTVAIKLKDVVKVGNVNPVTIDGEKGIITGLTNVEWDETDKTTSNKAASEAQLGKIERAIKTDISNINNTLGGMKNVVKYDDDTKNNIRLEGTNGTVITNIAKGKIIPGSTDAVTGAQLDRLQNILTGQNGAGTDLEFKVSLNNNNKFGPAYYTNVKDALEALKHGWRVAGGEIDHIAGATHIEQGETLVVSGDKNISTKISSTTVGKQEYKLTDSEGQPILDEHGQQKVEVFEGKIGTLSIALSDTPEFTNITVTNPGGDDNSVVTRKVLKDAEKLAVKYDTDAKDSITLNSSGTTIKNVKYGKNDTDAVNVKQIKDLVGGDIAYDGTKWTGMGFETLKGKGMPTEAPIGILEAIKVNTSAINRGLVFEGDNENNTPQYLGSKLSVKTDNIGTEFEGKNLKTEYKLDSDSGNGTIKIGLSKDPEFASMTLGKIKMMPGADTLTLSSDNEKVVLDGLKPGQDKSSAVTKGEIDEFKSQLGLNGKDGTSGSAGSTGPAGQDGLDGKSIIDKVQGLRDGMAGTMVYTDANGKRVVKDGDNYYLQDDIKNLKKASDGQYYKPENVNKDGSHKEGVAAETVNVVSKDNIRISAVNTKDGATTDPVILNNVKSVYDGGVSDLLGLSGKDLNVAATTKDLQAVAKAGLSFKGNDSKQIQRPLGSQLGIEGRKSTEYVISIDGNTGNSKAYSDVNMITHSDGDVIRIEMLKSPKFEGIVVNNGKDGANGKNSIITVDKNGNLIIKNGVSGQDGQPGADGLSGKDGKDGQKVATIKDVDDLSNKLGLNGKDGTSGTSGTNGPAGKDGLNGKSILDKVQGLRDGLAGTMVYTDKDGNRLVKEGNEYYKQSDFDNFKKANDGNYYNKVDKNGEPEDGATKLDINTLTKVEKDIIRISAVDPASGDTKDNRVALNNIKSALDLQREVITDTKANDAVKSLLNQTTDLDKAATGRDLQALAKAGINIKGNDTDLMSHIPLSGTYNIKGSDIEYKVNANGSSNANLYSSENLITHTDGKNTLRIEMLKSPKFETLNLVQGGNKTVTLTPGSGELKISNTSTPGDPNVVLSGLKGGEGKDTAVTKGQLDDLKKDIGLVSSGTSGDEGAAGKDGLDGKTISDKLQGLRDGFAGTVVYTDKDGNRLVRDINNNFYKREDVEAIDTEGKPKYKKANDGLYYLASSVKENGELIGEPKKADLQKVNSIKLSAVNQNGITTSPINLSNIRSGIGLSGLASNEEATEELIKNPQAINSQAAIKAVEKLVKQEGTILNNAANLMDLQALAQAGLTFNTNSKEHRENTSESISIHKYLGQSISILGKPLEPYTQKDFAGDNVLTHTEGESVIRIEMRKSPSFRDIVINGKDGKDGKSAIITVDKDGHLVVKDGVNGRDGLNGLDGTSGKDGRDGLTKIITERDMNSGISGTMVYTDKDGNRLVELDGKYYAKETIDDKTKDLVKVDGKYYHKTSINTETGEVNSGEKPVNIIEGLSGTERENVVISTVNPDGKTTTPTTIGNVKGLLDSGLADNITNNDIENYKTKLDEKKAAEEKAQKALDDAKATPTEQDIQQLEEDLKIAKQEVAAAEKTLNDEKNSIYNTLATKSEGVKAAKVVTEKLLGNELKVDTAATVGDLRTIAVAGLDFAGNDGAVIHRNLGTKFTIEGKKEASYSVAYSADNLITHLDGETLRIEMLKKPNFEGLVINNGKDGTDGTDGKSAVITVDDNGNVIVKNGIDGTNGVDGKDGFSKIITEKDLNAGTSGSNGADGLDGKSIVDKVNSLRDGLSGPMVYTDAAGNRIVKGNDGHFYAKGDIDSDGNPTGTALNEKDIHISAVNPDGSTQIATTLGNTKGIIREAMKEFEDTDVATAQTAVTKADKALTAAKDALTTAKNNFMSDASAVNRKAYFDAMNDVSNATKDLKAKKEALAVAEAKVKPEAVIKAETAIATAKTELTNANKALTAARKTLDEAQTAFEKNPTDVNIQTALEAAINDLATKEATRKNALNDLKEKKLALDKAKEDAIASEKVLLAQNAVKDKLLKAEGKDINIVATIGDLQAVALAGLDFAGNTGEAIHKNLGEKLNIEGMEKAVYDKDTYSSENLVTYNDNDTLRVAMLRNPKFNTVTLSDGTDDITLGVDGKDGIGIKGEDGKVDKFVTENKLDDKLQRKGFDVDVKDKDGNVKKLHVKLGDTLKFESSENNIVLKGTSGTGTSTSGGTTTGGTSGGTAGGSTTGGISGTSGTSEHTVDINLAKDLEIDNIKVTNNVEAKEVVADKVIAKEKVESKDVVVKHELKVGDITIKNGEITGVKTVELDESGHVAKEDEGKLVNGGTLNKTIDNLRAENAQFREGVQGAIQQNSQRISKLETKVNKGLANAAAMAGINFMEIGVNQATVGAAVGGYEGTQAVAVGVQAAPTQDLRINAKVSLTPGSHSSSMYSVGASWRFDLK